jgi:hypothetical protein
MPAVPTNMDTVMLRRLAKGTSYQGCSSSACSRQQAGGREAGAMAVGYRQRAG